MCDFLSTPGPGRKFGQEANLYQKYNSSNEDLNIYWNCIVNLELVMNWRKNKQKLVALLEKEGGE